MVTSDDDERRRAWVTTGGDSYSTAISDLRRNRGSAAIAKRLRARLPLTDDDFDALADWFEAEHKASGRPADNLTWAAAFRARTVIASWQAAHPNQRLTTPRRVAIIGTACREFERERGLEPGSIEPDKVAARLREAAGKWPEVYREKF